MTYAIVAACSSLQQSDSDAGRENPAATAQAPSPVAAPPPLPVSVALLLPLSGPQRAVGEAVRDGFIAAWLADPGAKAEVQVFDETQPDPTTAYRQAMQSGAGLIVGPLLKESVAQAVGVAQTELAIATLVLNFLDSDTPAPIDFHQFSLAPEDEARQVAERAAAEGRLRALALVPDTEWGRRMLAAFQPAFAGFGGQVLAQRYYDPAATDYTRTLQRLLLIDESRARHRELVAKLGVSLEFETRRREDVDFIFLAANVGAGRLIRPQLRFLYAGDIPVYATSAIFQAGSGGDADLDGIAFMDAPALIAPDARALAMQSALASRWPAGTDARLRFHAMGYDAWGLAKALLARAEPALMGLSGELSADGDQRIHRQMPWAQFREGRLSLLDSLTAPPAVTPAQPPLPAP